MKNTSVWARPVGFSRASEDASKSRVCRPGHRPLAPALCSSDSWGPHDSVAKERPRTPHICSRKGEMAKWNPGLNSLQDEPLISSCVTASGLKNTLVGPMWGCILGVAVQLGGGGMSALAITHCRSSLTGALTPPPPSSLSLRVLLCKMGVKISSPQSL